MNKLKVVLTTRHDPYSPIEFTMDADRAANYARSLHRMIDHSSMRTLYLDAPNMDKSTPFEAVELLLMSHLRGHNGYYHIPYENDDYPTHYVKCDDIVFVEFVIEKNE